MRTNEKIIIGKFHPGSKVPRDGVLIPFSFDGGPQGKIRLIGECPETPPTIIIEAPRSVEIEIISPADAEKEDPNVP